MKGADAVAILTAHAEYFQLNPVDVKTSMSQNMPVVVDGRNVVKPEEFIDGGFVYRGIVRGDVN